MFPYDYIPDPTQNKPLSLASIYFGEPSLDPEIEANRKTVYAVTETGNVAIEQPVKTGAGGVPLYNGSPVELYVEGYYSMKVVNSLGEQVYYTASVEYRQIEALVADVEDSVEAMNEAAATVSIIESWLNADWHNVLSSRETNEDYTNENDYPIDVAITFSASSASIAVNVIVYVAGSVLLNVYAESQGVGINNSTTYFSVPPGATYRIDDYTETATTSIWREKY